MSQIEQRILRFLSKHPEIEKCVQLINRRALARHLIQNQIAKPNEFEAVVATLRRLDYKPHQQEELALFQKIRVRVKDNITILDFEKSKELMQELKKLIDTTNYDKGETLKIVIGTGTIAICLDENNQEALDLLSKYKLNKKHARISEISILFPDEAIETRGIISYFARELQINDITITEMLTASSELLIYV